MITNDHSILVLYLELGVRVILSLRTCHHGTTMNFHVLTDFETRTSLNWSVLGR